MYAAVDSREVRFILQSEQRNTGHVSSSACHNLMINNELIHETRSRSDIKQVNVC